VEKRLRIGAIAALVIGVAVYFLSQPKKGTVEWHKKEYLKAADRLAVNTWKHKLKRVAFRVTGRLLRDSWDADAYRSDVKAFEQHQASLVRLGYLQEGRVSLTNAFSENAIPARYFGDEARRGFIAVSREGPQVVHIIAPPSDLPKIEAAIRRVDGPPSK
jgi:hypothetical protein